MSASILSARNHIKGETHPYVSPHATINAGIWSLFAGATVFLGLRLWCKVTRRSGTGIWYDDYILIVSWCILFINDIIISVEYATGYVQDHWDDRMRILINVTTCGTLLGQVFTKTAFGVTLLRISTRPLKMVLWGCIAIMHMYLVVKFLLQWGKVCGNPDYDVYYRIDFCVTDDVRDRIKEGGNIVNMMMDFVFAVFPWLITWKLKISRSEKISLCMTLSLGMIVAISTAVRTAWKNNDAEHDQWYFFDNAKSQVWYSSEICGTIIVQCIPILRPFLKDVAPKVRSRGYSFKKSQGSLSGGKQFSKSHSTRDSIPLQSMDRSNDRAGPGPFSPNRIDEENSPGLVTFKDPDFSGFSAFADSKNNRGGGPKPAPIEIRRWHSPDSFSHGDIQVDIQSIPPPSPMTPPPPPRGNTDVSVSAFSWLNDNTSEETALGLSPPPHARSRARIPKTTTDLMS